jgi:cytochrome b
MTEAGNLSPPPRVAQPNGDLLARLPHWAVALILLAPVLLVGQGSLLLLVPGMGDGDRQSYGLAALFLLALFLPGAIKRLKWRHGLVMLGFAALAIGAAEALSFLRVPRAAAFPAPVLIPLGVVILVLLVGVGEAFLARQRDGRTLAWVAGAAIAAGCAAAVVGDFVLWSDWQVNVPLGGGAYEHLKVGFLAYQLLVSMLTWTGVPAALAAGREAWRGSPSLMATAALASRAGVTAAVMGGAVAAFVGFYGLAAYPLAERSVDGKGPFPRSQGAMLLEVRGRDSDFERFWRDLENADWTQGPGAAGFPDWRDTYVGILSRHDGAETAARLSALLLSKPAQTLAWFAAELLAENKRYETAPLLMRFALRSRDGSPSLMATALALECMNVPQAAYPTLREAAVYAQRTQGAREGEDFELDPCYRERLTDLLGRDAGPNYLAWEKLYSEAARESPTPLAPETRAETDLTIQSFIQYWQARARLQDACRRLAEKMLADNGKLDAIAAFEQWLYQFGDDPRPPAHDEEVKAGARLAREYLDKAAKALTVAGPNWNAPTTQAFAEEIDAYSDRADKVIEEHLGPPAAPQAVQPP